MFYGKGPSFYNDGKMDQDAIRAVLQKRNIHVDLKELEPNSTSVNYLEQGVMKIREVITHMFHTGPVQNMIISG